MAQYNWNELLAQAEAAGGSFEITPVGDYDVTVVSTNVKQTQGGKDRVGFQLEITSGPRVGKKFWANQVLTPDNPKAVAVFARIFSQFGGNLDALRQGSSLEQAAASAVGTSGRAALTHREYNGKTYEDVRFSPGAPALAAPAAPVAPVAAPAAPVPAPAAAPANPSVPF